MKTARILIAILALGMLAGCTFVSAPIPPTGKRAFYLNVLNKKSVKMTPPAGSGWPAMEYNTESDPAVQIMAQAFAQGLAAGKAAAK